MHVRDAMTTPALTVRPDTPLTEVVGLLDEHAVTSLPVIDEHDHLVGMVGEIDVVRAAVPRDPGAHDLQPPDPTRPTRTSEVMTFNPVSVPPNLDLPVAASLLASSPVTCLPVVADGHVVGVLSRRDVVAVLARARRAQGDFHHREGAQEFQRSTTGLSRS